MIIGLVIVALLCSCKSVDNSQDQSTAAAASTTGEPEKITLRVVSGQHYVMPPAGVDSSNNPFINWMEEELNVDFIWEIIPSDQFQDKSNLIMSSGELPDVIFCNQVSMMKWSGQGLLVPLDEVINKTYPELLTKDIPKEAYLTAKINGKIYGIPTWYTGGTDPMGSYVRNDWLNNLNLPVPKTIDDFYNVLKAFTYDDPDKNGKDDTYGLGTDKSMDGLDMITMFFRVSPGMGSLNNSFAFWSKVDGKVIPDAIMPATKDALGFLNRLYSDKILYNESIVHDFSQWEEKIKTIYGSASYSSANICQYISLEMVKDNPEAYFLPIPPMEGPEGPGYMHNQTGVEGYYAVTSACKNPDRVVEMFKWAYAGEINQTNADKLQFGRNGEYKEDIEGFPCQLMATKLPEQYKNDKYRKNYILAWDSPNRYSIDMYYTALQAYVRAGLNFKTFPATVENYGKYGHTNDKYIGVSEEATYLPDLNKKWEEVRTKIITGQAPLSDFDKWVDYYLNNGGQKIIDAVNAAQK